MSQTNDPNGYETEGSSALKNVANEDGKVVAKSVAAKAATGSGIGLPAILGIVAVVLLFGFCAMAAFIIASGGEEARHEGSVGFWGGELSEIGANEIPAAFIPVYKAAEQKYGVSWNLIAAHHRVETRFSTIDPMISPVGAESHIQFMPCTWVGWGHGDIPLVVA